MATIEFTGSIIQKAMHVASMVQETEEYTRFKQAEYKMSRHPDAQALLFVVKAKRNAYSQKSLRYGYDDPKSIQAKTEYDEILDQMAAIPLIDEYQISQEELNDLLQGISRTIVNTLSPDVRVEISDDESADRNGCSSGGCGGGCKS